MTITIKDALIFSKEKRDNEILLSHALNHPRSFLYAHPEKTLSEQEEIFFKESIKRREQGEPIPYIIGHQEFWSLDFKVTKDTLIPRPETELLIERFLAIFPQEKKTIADLGTGSGCIALAIAHERPQWEIHAVDNSEKALAVAKENANHLKIKNCEFHLGEWCDGLPKIKFDAIVSNPPYIAENDPHLAAIQFEPQAALISGNNGLEDIQRIISQAKDFLKKDGVLMLEHGYNQGSAIRNLLETAGFKKIATLSDLAGHERITLAAVENSPAV